MSSQQTSNNPADSEALAAEAPIGDTDLASKLSKELSNWRRKRGGPGARFRDDRASVRPLSGPARTIKVRGHETLVLQKSKLAGKPRPDSTSPRA
jgi:hypothetical protein